MVTRNLAIFLFVIIFLTACSPQPQEPVQQATTTPPATPTPTSTNTPTLTPTITSTVTSTPTLLPMLGPVTDDVMVRLGKGWVNDLAFSPNGKILSVASSIGVYLYQADTAELLSFIPTNAFVNTTAFIDDRTLVSGESDGSTTVWDIKDAPTVLANLQRTGPVAGLGIAADKTIVITEFGFKGTSGVVNVIQWDMTNPEKVDIVSSEYGASTEYSPAKNMLILQTQAGKLILFDTQRMRSTAVICRDCYTYDFSQNGEFLVVTHGWDKGKIVLLETASQKEIVSFQNPEPRVSSLAFSPARKLLASASPTAINLWDVEKNMLVETFDGALNISFSPDGTLLASASQDGSLIIRDLPGGDTRFVGEGFTPINQAVFQNGYMASTLGYWMGDRVTLTTDIIDYYFTGSDRIFLRDSSTGEIIRTFTPAEENPDLGFDEVRMVFTPDEKVIATTWESPENTIVLFDVGTGETLKFLEGLAPLAFSPDGQLLAANTTENQLIIWDIASSEILPLSLGLVPAKFDEPYRSSLVFSPDGSMIVVLSDQVVFRDLLTGKPVKTLESGLDPGLAFGGFNGTGTGPVGAFSPNGRILASTWLVATSDGKYMRDSKGVIQLWDVLTGEKIALLDGHASPMPTEFSDSNAITALAFSPDGEFLASGAEDNTIIIWDVQKGTAFKELKGHVGAITGLSFSSDGKKLYSNALDGTVIIWNMEKILP